MKGNGIIMKARTLLGILAAPLTAIIVAAGCQNGESSERSEPKAMSVAPPMSGAQLWSDNCSRCHNIRPPQSYNDAQWAVVTHHMRLRANLTGEETRLITEFLQASH
jgi:hypothetical protein